MNEPDHLYDELKPDLQALATPLLEFSTNCVKYRGAFLPHGAVLTDSGEVRLVAAVDDASKELTSAVEVLPVLHQGLRDEVARHIARAIAVAEDVTVTFPGQRPKKAIKVLIEHKRGMTVAVYLSFQKKIFRGYTFGKPVTVDANAEVNAWCPPPPNPSINTDAAR